MDTLHEDPRNARSHNERNLATIRKSLETYGQVKPIVVNADGSILAGNGLYRAAKSLGWTEIAVVYVKFDEDYARGYAVMDNRASDLSSFDLPNLKDILESLDASNFDLEATGFQRHEIEMMMTAVHQDDAPEGGESTKREVTCPECGHVFTP